MSRSPLIPCALLALCAAAPALASEGSDATPPTQLTDAEREKAIAYLLEVQGQLHAQVVGLSGAQFRFRAGDERWTVAEIVEHVTLAEQRLSQAIAERLPQTPVLAPEQRPRLPDHAVRMATTNRVAQTFQAPERVKPTGRDWSPGQALAAFDAVHASLLEYVRTTSDDLRAHALDNPVLGPIDGYQWLLFGAAHVERHLGQIREVTEHEAYPAG